MTSQASLQSLFESIPLLESGVFKDAHLIYITTGDYPPHVQDLLSRLRESGIATSGSGWLEWVEQARPYLQAPETIASARPEIVEKLLSVATYADSYNKSFFPYLCSSGFMLELLKKLRDQQTH